MESWGKAAAVPGSSSSGSQGLPGRHEQVSRAEGRCFEGLPADRCWEANWPCWCNRAGKESDTGIRGEEKMVVEEECDDRENKKIRR